ncbi:MAG: hypothetical protein ACP5EK_06330 [Thermoplasmatota archaeon]
MGSATTPGAYEAEIQETLAEIFRLMTPFVHAEPCRGFVDHIVYINDENLTTWIRRILDQRQDAIQSACRYHQGGICRQHPDGSCRGTACPRYRHLKSLRHDLVAWFHPGIHLMEIKSNHDNVQRFAYQLPQYCLFGDYIWLVVEDASVPTWLPPFVGLIRYHRESLVVEHEATRIDRVPRLDARVVRRAYPQMRKIQTCTTFLAFLRAWFINSIFNDGWGNYIVEMPPLGLLSMNQTSKRNRYTLTRLSDFEAYEDTKK